MRFAFKGKDVGADTIKEKPVVRDDHGAAGKIHQRIFQRAQGFHIKIIGRLIEQQHIAAFFQKPRHMHAVAFPAGQQPDLLLLIAAFEIKG